MRRVRLPLTGASAAVAAAAIVVVAGAAIVAAACARPMPPPGGDRDLTPPRLIATSPEPLAVVPPGNQPVVFFFDERISERNFSESLVLVSPLDSSLRVDRSRAQIRVRIDGGWRPNRVYRVVLLPGLRDLFGNMRNEPVELVFSTGPQVTSTALAGIVVDRVTGEPARQGVINAIHTTDNARYVAMADSTGFFSLRYLPLGVYDVFAYDDQNRNRRLDLLEPVDSGYAAAFDVPVDTVTVVFNVLSPDTTAPRIMRAAALDSLNVRVDVDDAVDLESLQFVRAEVHALPDSTRYAGAIRTITPLILEEERRLAADSVALPSQPLQLPTRELVVVLDRPLAPGSYAITVTGVTNLHGLIGGGTARFDVAERPPRPVAPPDTSGVGLPLPPPDTGGAAAPPAPPDTGGAGLPLPAPGGTASGTVRRR